MKRLWVSIFLIILLVMVGLCFWQPAGLQQLVIHETTERVNASTPYRLHIGAVRWNIFTGLRLEDIRLEQLDPSRELLRVPLLRARLDWVALFHHHLRISRLTIVEPVLTIPLDQLPVWPASSKPASTQRVDIESYEIRDGVIRLQKTSDSVLHEAILNEVLFRGQLTADEILISHASLRLGDGQMTIEGGLNFRPATHGHLSIDTRQFPFQKVVALFSPIAARFPLNYSGHTTAVGGSTQSLFRSNGRLSGTELSAQMRMSGPATAPDLNAIVMVSRPPSDSQPRQDIRASIQWKNGKGPIESSIHYGALAAQLTGRADIHSLSASGDFSVAVASLAAVNEHWTDLHGKAKARGHFEVNRRDWLITGEGEGEQIEWHGRALQAIHATVDGNAHFLKMGFKANQIKLHSDQTTPWDIMSINGSVSGHPSLWQLSVLSNFRNGSALETAGSLTQSAQRWDFMTTRLQLSVPSSGLWQANAPVHLRWSKGGAIECENLNLIHGGENIALHRLLWSPAQDVIEASAHLDPSSFNGLTEAVEFSKGSTLDLQWTGQGQWPHLHSEGTLKGRAERLVIKPIHLTLRHWACDAQSVNNAFTIQNCSGEPPHGTLALTGHSTLPDLQLNLRGSKVAVQYEKTFKGTADLALDLNGSLDAPELTGDLQISDALYNAPPAKKSKDSHAPPAVSSAPVQTSYLLRDGRLDLRVRWPRDVWYRDGASSIETRGDLRIQKAKGELEYRLTGSITSVRGNYSYLGRSFSIDSGELQFPGTPGFNPLLKVEASYPAEAIVVYLDVTGSLDAPELKLRSNPPLSDQDIVSVIAFGRPISELRSSGGVSTNQQMEAAAGSVLGGYVTNELRTTGLAPLEFDVFDVQPTAAGSQWTVGRYLTRKLYISYGQTLATSANKAFDADYFLTDRWMLEAETGSTQGNHLDLLFRYPLNAARTDTGSNRLKSPFRNTLDYPTAPGQSPMPLTTSP